MNSPACADSSASSTASLPAHVSNGDSSMGNSTQTVARIPEMATVEMLNNLPALDDDDDIGKELEHVVRRDDQRDLKFLGILLASAAPDTDTRGRWMELRVYQTSGGNFVFSRIGRSVLDGERDKFEADVFNEFKSSLIADKISKQPTWETAAMDFFGFTALAKALYAKLDIEAAELLE